ncbi:MAG TPA: hypothetical protein VKY92_09880 [Verrucomicrobiae bacterium]|nr:hypothetical protein [Verrucomicrobiae bacterium]
MFNRIRFALVTAVALICATTAVGQEIDLHNKTTTFTNLEGRVFERVTLSKGDFDGVIWRKDTSAGRVSYTNLAPELIESWGIPTNRIALAKARAERRAKAKSAELSSAAEEADQRERDLKQAAIANAKAQKIRAINDAYQAKVDQINALKAAIARDKALRQQAWDRWVYVPSDAFSVTANSRGPAAVDTDASRLATARAFDTRIEQEQAQLDTLEAELGPAPRPTGAAQTLH